MKQSLKVLGAGLASVFLAATTHGAVFGDGGVGLQSVLDGITTSPAGNSSINVLTDEVPEGLDSRWQIGGSGGAIATVVVEIAGFADDNQFGIYDTANPANRVVVATGAAGAGDRFTITILATGEVVVEQFGAGIISSGTHFAANNFGFFLDSSARTGGGLWHSDSSLNADGLDHLYAYQGVGDMIQLPPFAAGPWGSNEYILAWEDLYGLGDADYNDFVILVESVSPVPDGGMSLMLLGIGLVGLARFGRRS